MYIKFIKVFIITLLLLFQSIGNVEAVAWDTLELDSYKWLVTTYKLNCGVDPCQCTQVITCGTGNNTIVSILINKSDGSGNTFPLPSINRLTFNNLKTFVIDYSTNIYPSTATTNIMTMINELPMLESLSLISTNNGTIPSSFPSQLPKLTNLILSKNGIKTISSNFWSSSLQNVLLGEELNSISLSPSPSLLKLQFSFSSTSSELVSLSFTTLQFPKLTDLYINFSTPSVQFSVDIGVLSLKSLSLFSDIGGSQGTFTITESINLESLVISKFVQATFIPKDLRQFNKLKNIEISNSSNNGSGITYLPPNLESLTLNQSNSISQFPNFTFPLSLTYLNLNYNTKMTGDLPSNFLQGNSKPTVLITGSAMRVAIPSTVCSFSRFVLDSTVTSYPSCIACQPPNGPIQISYPSSSITCQPHVNNITHVLINDYYITITGSDLGWAVSGDSTSGLDTISPNTILTYKINPNTQPNPVPITFSSYQNIVQDVYWINAVIIINETTTILQDINSTVVDIYGDLSDTGENNITLNGRLCDQTVIVVAKQNVRCLLNGILPEGDYILSFSNQYNSVNQSLHYSYVYPVVTSYESITNNGGLLELGGVFGITPTVVMGANQTNDTTVLINGITCDVQFKNQSYISCLIGNLTVGNAILEVNVGGYNFKMNNLRVNPTSLLIQCIHTTNNCTNGNGVCNIRGSCDCKSGYYGQNCQSQSGSGVFIPNNATGSFQASGYLMSFKLESIQELDLSNQVTRQIIPENWTMVTNETSLSGNRVAYQLNMTGYGGDFTNVNITIFIEFTSVEKKIQFAGSQFTLAPNSLKVSLQINNWIYLSNLNHLRPVFRTVVSGGEQEGGCASPGGKIGMDSFQSIKYLSIVKNNTLFYSRFLDLVESDGRAAYTQNQLLSDPQLLNNQNAEVLIGVNLPYCSRCLMDPDFSPLVQSGGGAGSQSECTDDTDKKSFSTWKVVAIVVVCGCVVGSAIAAFSIYKYKLNQKQLKRKEAHDRINSIL